MVVRLKRDSSVRLGDLGMTARARVALLGGEMEGGLVCVEEPAIEDYVAGEPLRR